MPDASKKTKRQPHQASQRSIHHWFWQDFTLQPATAESSHDSDKKISSSGKFHDWARALHDTGKTASAGTACLHQWFWQDFAVSPRNQGAHRHESHQGTSDWCLHDCLVHSHE